MPEGSSDPTADEERRRRRQRRLQVLVVVVATTAECLQVIWTNMTDQQRQLAMMRLWAAVERSSGALARRVGEREMRVELAGGRPAYEVPAALSLVRDAASRRYEALRYA